MRGAAGNRSAVIVEIAGTAHEGAGRRTGLPIQLVEVVGQISAERKRTAERVLTGQLAGGRHRAAKGEASGGDAPVEVVDAEVAGTRIEVPIHIHVAGGDVGHPAVAANVGGDVADGVTLVGGGHIDAATTCREILIVAEQNLVADSVDVEAGLIPTDALHIEGRTERGEEVKVDIGQVKIVSVVGNGVELDAVTLVLEVVAIVHRADIDGAPVWSRDRLGIEGEVDAIQGDGLRSRGSVRISLPANAAEDRGAEGRRLSLDGELLQIEPHLRGNFGRDIRIGDHLREIAARDLVARMPSSSSRRGVLGAKMSMRSSVETAAS